MSITAWKTSRPAGLGQLSVLVWLAASAYAYSALIVHRPQRIVVDPIEAWFFEAGDTAPQIAYVVFLFFLWNRRERVRVAMAAPGAWPLGGAVLIAGVLLYAWGDYVAQIDLLFDAFLVCSAGGALLLGGRRLLGVLGVPLFYLWLARPISPVFALQAHGFLIDLTGTLSHGVVSLLGGPTLHTGDLILYGERWFHVIDSCSGFRITHTLMTSALVYAELFGLDGRRRWLLFFAALPIGILVNTGRVVGIMVNPWGSGDVVHSTQGIAMLVVGVLMLPLIDRLYVRWVGAEPAPHSAEAQAAEQSWLEVIEQGRNRAALIAVSLAALVTAGLAASPLRAARPEVLLWSPYAIERHIEGWEFEVQKIPKQHLGVARFDDARYLSWQRGDDEVAMLAGATDRRRRDHSGLTPKARVPSEGWQIIARSEITLPWPGKVERLLLERGVRSRLAYFWRMGDAPLPLEIARWYAALDVAPWRHPRSVLTLRIDTAIEPGQQEAGDRRLRSFLEALEPAVRAIEPASADGSVGT